MYTIYIIFRTREEKEKVLETKKLKIASWVFVGATNDPSVKVVELYKNDRLEERVEKK